jgi:hypothetical protein
MSPVFQPFINGCEFFVVDVVVPLCVGKGFRIVPNGKGVAGRESRTAGRGGGGLAGGRNRNSDFGKIGADRG